VLLVVLLEAKKLLLQKRLALHRLRVKRCSVSIFVCVVSIFVCVVSIFVCVVCVFVCVVFVSACVSVSVCFICAARRDRIMWNQATLIVPRHPTSHLPPTGPHPVACLCPSQTLCVCDMCVCDRD